MIVIIKFFKNKKKYTLKMDYFEYILYNTVACSRKSQINIDLKMSL